MTSTPLRFAPLVLAFACALPACTSSDNGDTGTPVGTPGQGGATGQGGASGPGGSSQGGPAGQGGTNAQAGASGQGGGGGQSGDAGLTGPDDVWTWVPVDGAVCANGSPTGFAVNLKKASDKVVVFFEGGGACWSGTICGAGFARHVDGYNQSTFEDPSVTDQKYDLDHTYLITERSNPQNPYRDATIVYVPYCTGDVHAGNNVATYTDTGSPVTIHHVGYQNATLDMQKVAAALPGIKHVTLSGYSAGGFGAMLHIDNAASIFAGARIDLINDSGFPIEAVKNVLSFTPEWHFQLPAGCTECQTNPAAATAYYSKKYPKSRFALLSYTQDNVLPTFFFFNQSPPPNEFEKELFATEKAVDAMPNVKYFVVDGAFHVLMDQTAADVKAGKLMGQIGGEATSQGVTLTAWINQMASDDAAWASKSPAAPTPTPL